MEDREADRKELPKRHRYYSSIVESKLLSSGKFYETLPDYISITILSYDPFLAGDMYYEAKTTLVSHRDIEYDDGKRYIFLYGGGNYNIPSGNTHGNVLAEMVKYIVTGELGENPGEETHRLSDIVNNVKDRSEVTKTYMKEWDRQRIHDRELTEKVTDSINSLNAILIEAGRYDDLKRTTEDHAYQKKLMEELLHEENTEKTVDIQ